MTYEQRMRDAWKAHKQNERFWDSTPGALPLEDVYRVLRVAPAFDTLPAWWRERNTKICERRDRDEYARDRDAVRAFWRNDLRLAREFDQKAKVTK